MNLKRILFFTILLTSTFGFSQNFNVEEVAKAKLVNVTGGASANAVVYSGNAARDPFTYFLKRKHKYKYRGLIQLAIFIFLHQSKIWLQQTGFNESIEYSSLLQMDNDSYW